MPKTFSPLRKTVFDLHLERERLPWYFRALAVVSSWLALGGYILFSMVFTSIENNLKISRVGMTVLASALVIVGYVAISITAWFSKSLLFCFDCVLLPILTASIMGVFVIVIHHALHHTFPIKTDLYFYIPLATACILTAASGALFYLAFRRLNDIKATDNRHRISTTRLTYGDTDTATNTATAAAAGTELRPMRIPEDEAQRQQLLRLLLKRESGRTPSPDTESTYHIDLPSSLAGNEGRQYLAVPTQDPGRGRSDSLPTATSTNRWQLGNLMPGRNRSPTVDSFKDPRQKRREEIERGGSMESTTKLLSDPWPSPAPYSPIPQPAWASTRYA
jgi:hypothetical protein